MQKQPDPSVGEKEDEGEGGILQLRSKHLNSAIATMLDINDFIAERGGDPKKIKESQRRRHAPEEVVDEVIAMFEDHRKSMRCYVLPCSVAR